MKVLVTDGHTRISLYVIRSIGSRGIDVTAQVEQKYDNLSSFGCKSRYVKEKIVTSTDPVSEKKYINELASLAKSHDVLIPIKTETIMAVAKNADLFRNVGCFIPEYDKIKLLQNKFDLCRYASRIGIPTPKTYFPESMEHVSDISKEIKYPAYVKLREEGDYAPQQRYIIAKDQHQLLRLYPKMHRRGSFPLIQEKIHGVGLGFFALFDEVSKPIAYFGHRRIRQFPYLGGPSSCCASHKNSRVFSLATELLSSLHWRGLAMVEFIQDEHDGIPKLLEVNPRFWGSTPLAVSAGIDFPYLLFRLSLGQKIEQDLNYREGVKIRFLVNDVMAVLDNMRHGSNKTKYVFQFIKDLFDFKIRDGIISFKDFRPSMAYLGMLIEKKLKSGA